MKLVLLLSLFGLTFARIFETSSEIYDDSGENITGPVLLWVDPDLIFDCQECIRRSKIFLRFNTSAGDTVQDHICLTEPELRRMEQDTVTRISHFCCLYAQCDYPYIKYPMAISQIGCSVEMDFPAYLRNVVAAFPNFTTEDLIAFVNRQEGDWWHLRNNFTSLWSKRMDCFEGCDVNGTDNTILDEGAPWIYPEDGRLALSIWSPLYSLYRWYHGF